MTEFVIALDRAVLIDQEGRQPRLTSAELDWALLGLERLGHVGRVRVVALQPGRRAALWLDTVLGGGSQERRWRWR
jgi:hypothetical protein